MHRLIQDHLEEVLAESNGEELGLAAKHLAECSECREEVSILRGHATMLRTLRAGDENLAPRPGFYARVMERIESQPASIWSAPRSRSRPAIAWPNWAWRNPPP